MKFLPSLVIVLLLVGCSRDQKTNPDVQAAASESVTTSTAMPSEASAPQQVASEVIVKYKGSDNNAYELKSSNNFETAVITDSHGKTYELKEAISGSGMRLEGDHGIYIHVKGEEGTLELEKDKPIDVQEVK